MRAALVTRLSLLTTLGVPLAGGRVYASFVPEGTVYPCIRVTMISDRRQYAMGGAIGHSKPRVQIDVFSPDHDAATRTAAQVVSSMDSWEGAAKVKATALVNQRDGYDNDEQVFMVSLDYEVLYAW